MYAIVDFMGYQFKIEKDATIKVPFMANFEVGNEVQIDRILMIHNEDKVSFGSPIIEAAKATAEVMKHGREDKIRIFKKKRRKGYRKTQGHRQNFTEIKIKELTF